MRVPLLIFASLAVTHAFPGRKFLERFKKRITRKQQKGDSTEVCKEVPYPPGALPLLQLATSAYKVAFSGVFPTTAAQAPGRVNLIGEHTDYTGGFVLPLALEKRTVVVGSGAIVDVNTEDSDCIIASVGVDGGNTVSFDADPATLAKGDPFWANYVKGVVKQYSADLPEGKKFTFKAIFASDVPLGAGLSSSAALEVATATFLETIAGVVVPQPEEKALRCQAAEHEFCGMPCGIMDQFVSALAAENHLLQIDCRANKGTRVSLGPSDSELPVILITDSKVKHELTGSEYPSRVAQCEAASQLIAAEYPEVEQLRDATPTMLDAAFVGKSGTDDVTYRRARHVIHENARVEGVVQALSAGDFATAGKLMIASHMSLKNDFEVSTPQLDKLVDLAIGFDGVYGARMTGGGFGGCVVSLVKAAAVDKLVAHLEEGYQNFTGIKPESFVTRPGTGASSLVPLKS